MNEKKDLLVIIDTSYFLYYCAFSAVNRYKKYYEDEANSIIRPKEERGDDYVTPDVTIYPNFQKVLHEVVVERLSSIDSIVKENFGSTLVTECNRVRFILALDNVSSNEGDENFNFRWGIYPEYKAQRLLIDREVNISRIKKYITNVIFPSIDDFDSYIFINSAGAEGDDLIATIVNNYYDKANLILIASDKDFLQLADKVKQVDLFGKPVEPIVNKTFTLTPKEYLLMKIIVGDKSDNIPHVFDKVAEVKAIRMIKDQTMLRERLSDPATGSLALQQFKLNRQLIDFNLIPKSLTESILTDFKNKLAEHDAKYASSRIDESRLEKLRIDPSECFDLSINDFCD